MNDAMMAPFGKLDHVGMVVRNMEKALATYRALGIDSFEPLRLMVFDRKLRGKSADDFKQEMRMGQLGETRLELIQPISGESLHKMYLEKQGEGINHLGFRVDSIGEEEARLINNGFLLVFNGKFKPDGGFAYFEREENDSYYVEVVQWPSNLF